MRGHDYYDELCALSVIGELGAAEEEDLREHLRACDSCRDAQRGYGLIHEQIPSVADEDCCNTAKLVERTRRDTFVRRTQQAGIWLTEEAIRGTHWRPWWKREARARWCTACWATAAFAAVVLASLLYLEPQKKAVPRDIAGDAVFHTLKADSASQVVVPEVSSVAPIRSKDESDSEKEIETLRAELKQAKAERNQAQTGLSLWRDRAAEESHKSETSAQALEEAKAVGLRVKSDEAELVAAIVEKEQKIEELSGAISAQKAAVERDRELKEVAPDVRELMGARNLHMIDVADVDGRGKARKSFGRVFYVEGKSLLFYAFDLAETSSRAKVLFQAWGQREGAGEKPINLGVFRVDDQVQRRWILRVDDPKLLSSIDSLFVTVESAPGTNAPTGRRLVYAYLGTAPNHP